MPARALAPLLCSLVVLAAAGPAWAEDPWLSLGNKLEDVDRIRTLVLGEGQQPYELGRLELQLPGPVRVGSLSWSSPDGQRLAYLTQGGLWLAEASGWRWQLVAMDPAPLSLKAAWAPDGRSLLLLTPAGELSVVDLEGNVRYERAPVAGQPVVDAGWRTVEGQHLLQLLVVKLEAAADGDLVELRERRAEAEAKRERVRAALRPPGDAEAKAGFLRLGPDGWALISVPLGTGAGFLVGADDQVHALRDLIGPVFRPAGAWAGHRGVLTDAAWSPDGKFLALTYRGGEHLRVPLVVGTYLAQLDRLGRGESPPAVFNAQVLSDDGRDRGLTWSLDGQQLVRWGVGGAVVETLGETFQTNLSANRGGGFVMGPKGRFVWAHDGVYERGQVLANGVENAASTLGEGTLAIRPRLFGERAVVCLVETGPRRE